VSDTTATLGTTDYARLGLVANPFPPVDPSGADPLWMRLVTRAAANRLLSATLRARLRSVPVLVTMVDEIPEYYYRVAQNDFLARAAEPSLGIMALSIPLEMMKLGRIRATLAELAELVAAVDLPLTLAAWFDAQLHTPETGLPQYDLVTAEELAQAARAFADDPHGAIDRYLEVSSEPVSIAELDAVVHEAYLRQVAQQVDPDKAEESSDAPESADGRVSGVPDGAGAESGRDSDSLVRDYLFALARTRLSPVLSRALEGFGAYGESLTAQELKVTKAPRKTLAAVLRLMNARWDNITIIYDNFDAWPLLDQQTKMDVLASLTELRWIIAEAGVMVVAVFKGRTIELEEQFAAAEQVDWSMPELTPLYGGVTGFNAVWVQSWLDAASVEGPSRFRADGPEFAPLVAASDNDLVTFSVMAEAAFRDAAERSVDHLDPEAVASGIEAHVNKGLG
jgi:hypothetical protein